MCRRRTKACTAILVGAALASVIAATEAVLDDEHGRAVGHGSLVVLLGGLAIKAGRRPPDEGERPAPGPDPGDPDPSAR